MSDEEFTVTLPKLGESIMSATVVQWFKKEGDIISLDEPLLEVSTDKVNSEIPSPVKGVVKKILAEPDTELDVGAPLALISTSDAPSAAVEAKITKQKTTCDQSMSGFYSPSVLRLAQEKGLSVDQLAKMQGSGAGGRITKKDLENYTPSSKAPTIQAGATEQVQLTGMRKMIADKMVQSSTEIPHATLVSEVDVTDALALIAREKEAFTKQHGVKPTITALIAKAISVAAGHYPMFNATFDGSTLSKHASVNVGIAVSLEKGLMVPVIKECNAKSIPEIAKAVADFAARARSNTLNPDDVQNGTITMTNFGMGGTLIGIPIIRHPEVAIIGIGAIERKVVPTDDDNFAIRKKVFISCTFDHRIIDGMDGCHFLAALKKHLEQDFSLS
ncbi:MAG: 2-oxo acid dehydrogenase subunit E2 [Chlamydiales bacterium]|nr:2-oxo acid dehydrogenase subunit E2 [Chlamydiales bacterium]